MSMKFIVVTSGLLFAGYYQASGGADFQPIPRAESEAAVAQLLHGPSETATAEPVVMASAVTGDSPAPAAPEPGVTNAIGGEGEIILASASAGPLPMGSTPEVATRASIDPAVANLPLTRRSVAEDPTEPTLQPEVSRNAGSIAAAGSLLDPVDQGEVELAAATTPSALEDIRQVAASWVNMRQGPGTGFPVVDQLGEGTEVEVLKQREGWLHLRDTQSGRTGWMAAWLVSSPVN